MEVIQYVALNRLTKYSPELTAVYFGPSPSGTVLGIVAMVLSKSGLQKYAIE